MKKKMFFAIATGFFAVATVLNMNILQANSAGDVSLESIAVMAQAQSEFTKFEGPYVSLIPWMRDHNNFVDQVNNTKGFSARSGSPCYGSVTTTNVGGSYTSHNSTTESQSVNISFRDLGASHSVTNSTGQSQTVNWNTSYSQVLLGYEIVCEPINVTGSCESRTCDEVRMNF